MMTPMSVEVRGQHGATRPRPGDGRVFEPAGPVVPRTVLVGDRVAEAPGLPAELRPQVADLAVHLERAEVGAPVDGTALEVVEPPVSRAAPGLVRDRVTQEAAVSTALRPLNPDGAVYLERAEVGAP